MGRRLYVGNLPYTTTDEELTSLFGSVAPVETVRVMRDLATGRARGFAFIQMASDDGAKKAIDAFHQYPLAGRPLVVNEARPKPEGGRGGDAFPPAATPATAGRAASRAGRDHSSTIHPSRRRMTRSLKAAFASECVTWMIVVPGRIELLEQLHDLAALLGVQVACRLVGQNHLRAGDDGARHGDELLLAAGQLVRVEVLLADDLKPVQHVAHDAFAFGCA